jgi:hypothetical protein
MRPAIVHFALFCSLTGCAVAAEEANPIAPNLEETMRVLKANLPAKVNYIVYGHDVDLGTTTAVKRSFELTVTTADADRCVIGVRYRFDNGKIGRAREKSADIDLRQVDEVALRPLVEVVQEVDDSQGHREHRVKVDPPISLVLVKTSGDAVMFNFYDEAVAQGVTKALQHAVALCSGSTLGSR